MLLQLRFKLHWPGKKLKKEISWNKSRKTSFQSIIGAVAKPGVFQTNQVWHVYLSGWCLNVLSKVNWYILYYLAYDNYKTLIIQGIHFLMVNADSSTTASCSHSYLLITFFE